MVYIGDSILGYKAHLGVGAKITNVRTSSGEVTISTLHGKVPTGLKKFGAAIGDGSKIGANSVLNPGTIIGRYSIIYPLASIRGIIPENAIVKIRQTQEIVFRKTS
jgi:acetyltransferase-like isoleucine patch superfamily enzyme